MKRLLFSLFAMVAVSATAQTPLPQDPAFRVGKLKN